MKYQDKRIFGRKGKKGAKMNLILSIMETKRIFGNYEMPYL